MMLGQRFFAGSSKSIEGQNAIVAPTEPSRAAQNLPFLFKTVLSKGSNSLKINQLCQKKGSQKMWKNRFQKNSIRGRDPSFSAFSKTKSSCPERRNKSFFDLFGLQKIGSKRQIVAFGRHRRAGWRFGARRVVRR